MLQFKFHCDHCNGILQAASDASGSIVSCPTCRGGVLGPNAPGDVPPSPRTTRGIRLWEDVLHAEKTRLRPPSGMRFSVRALLITVAFVAVGCAFVIVAPNLTSKQLLVSAVGR